VKRIIIAIDGFSSCGKSTLAKALGKSLHYAYIDTGAMYRAVTLHFIRNNIDIDNPLAVADALMGVEVHFERVKGHNHIFLNGEDVESEIRQMYVSDMVSPVATLSVVRRAMVKQQQAMGKRKGIVMDGRDIGTVVFPNAELKVFLTAQPDIRAQRRMDEMAAKGQSVEHEVVKKNLMERDRIDSSRADSPLRQADDAILIDNSYLSESEQLQKVLELYHSVVGQQ
jgi:CMP/dCMP kinase